MPTPSIRRIISGTCAPARSRGRRSPRSASRRTPCRHSRCSTWIISATTSTSTASTSRTRASTSRCAPPSTCASPCRHPPPRRRHGRRSAPPSAATASPCRSKRASSSTTRRWCRPSPRCGPTAPGRSRPAGRSFEAARELTSRIKADFAYEPGATDISTPLAEVFAGKSGVCQDFAHVEIAALRAHGLAARYVSGYIRTVHSKEEIALRGADASHAWVAVWCGEAAGWVHLDPTNDLVAHEDHVAVAWGRDFSDVSPLRGVILGGDSHSYGVAVTLVPAG